MRHTHWAGRLILTAGLLAALGAAALAQSGGYDLSWWTVDGGGATFSAGGPYTLGGTIGQAEAGVVWGGRYMLGGGFWGGEVALARLYLPVVLRSYP